MLQNIFEQNCNVFMMLHLEKGFHFRNGFDVTTKNLTIIITFYQRIVPHIKFQKSTHNFAVRLTILYAVKIGLSCRINAEQKFP